MDKQNSCNFNFNRSGDLICTRFVHEKQENQRQAQIAKSNEVHIVTKGRGLFLCNGRKAEICEGSLFFVSRGDNFSIESLDDLEYCYICFSGRRGEELMERLDISDVRCCFDGQDELVRFWLSCLEMTEKGNVDLMSEAVLLYTLAVLDPAETKQSDLISTMISVTNECFSDSEFNLLALSSRIGYDDKYISSVFKKQKGITYSQYLRNLRIRHAVFLIEQGIVSVKNIAILSGFGDPLYFSKVFKSSEGISPKDYIKKVYERKQEQNKD